MELVGRLVLCWSLECPLFNCILVAGIGAFFIFWFDLIRLEIYFGGCCCFSFYVVSPWDSEAYLIFFFVFCFSVQEVNSYLQLAKHVRVCVSALPLCSLCFPTICWIVIVKIASSSSVLSLSEKIIAPSQTMAGFTCYLSPWRKLAYFVIRILFFFWLLVEDWLNNQASEFQPYTVT